MDKQNASKLLDDSFNEDFDVNRLLKFTKELFNGTASELLEYIGEKE